MCGGGWRGRGVGMCMKVKMFVAHLCPAFCDPRDRCSPPGSSGYGILQARILEWVAIPFFPIQGSNPGLLRCRQILYRLSHCEGRRVEGNNKKKVKKGKESFLPPSLRLESQHHLQRAAKEELRQATKSRLSNRKTPKPVHPFCRCRAPNRS